MLARTARVGSANVRQTKVAKASNPAILDVLLCQRLAEWPASELISRFSAEYAFRQSAQATSCRVSSHSAHATQVDVRVSSRLAAPSATRQQSWFGAQESLSRSPIR